MFANLQLLVIWGSWIVRSGSNVQAAGDYFSIRIASAGLLAISKNEICCGFGFGGFGRRSQATIVYIVADREGPIVRAQRDQCGRYTACAASGTCGAHGD